MTTGLTQDAGWQIGVSRTLEHPRDVVWAALVSPAGLALWLGPGSVLPGTRGEAYAADDGTTGELRSLRPLDRVRVTRHPVGRPAPTLVQVAVTGRERAAVRFHEDHLADAAEREARRAHWRSVLEAFEALLER